MAMDGWMKKPESFESRLMKQRSDCWRREFRRGRNDFDRHGSISNSNRTHEPASHHSTRDYPMVLRRVRSQHAFDLLSRARARMGAEAAAARQRRSIRQ